MNDEEPDLFGIAEELAESQELKDYLVTQLSGRRGVALERYVRRHLCLRLKNDYDPSQVDRVLMFLDILT